MYCCLNYELEGLPILSEYAHTKDGRIDFYVFDRKWGIEVLQSGSKTDIKKYADRFLLGRKYRAWNIFEDYIILNFCSKFKLQTVEIEGNAVIPSKGIYSNARMILDIDVYSHLLQISIDPDKSTAEVYTHNGRLLKTLALGEGRQRLHVEEIGPTFELEELKGYLVQAGQIRREMVLQTERAEGETELKKQELEEMKQRAEQREQEIAEMKRKLEQVGEEMKQLMGKKQQRRKRRKE